MQFSKKIDGFEQKDSQGFENSYNSYEQYPLEKNFIFTIYQNYTLALITLCSTPMILVSLNIFYKVQRYPCHHLKHKICQSSLLFKDQRGIYVSR